MSSNKASDCSFTFVKHLSFQDFELPKPAPYLTSYCGISRVQPSGADNEWLHGQTGNIEMTERSHLKAIAIGAAQCL